MVILGIESATPHNAVALVSTEEKLLVEVSAQLRGQQPLLDAIESALNIAGISKREISAIAYSKGPGGFTGLRSGLCTAKGISYALGVPMVGVSTLEAFALRFSGALAVAPLLDAKKGQVYGALYHNGECLVTERAADPKEMAAALSAVGQTILAVGDGAALVAKHLTGSHVFLPKEPLRAESVARLGLRAVANGLTESPIEAVPSYLRLSEAEINGPQPTKLPKVQ